MTDLGGTEARPTAEERARLLLEVLDDVELSFRMGDMRRLQKVAFVWAQRREALLAGAESWKDQRIGGFHPVPRGQEGPSEGQEEGHV